MKIARAFPRIMVVTECGRTMGTKMRLNMEDGILEVLAPSGTVWASAKTIEGLQQKLYGLTIEAKDLGDEDVK